MYHKKRDEMITEDYVSFGVAKLLKEKGFNEPCHKAYNYEGCLCTGFTYGPYAPTLQMAVKWLREKHNLAIATYLTGDGWRSGVSRIKFNGEGFIVDIIDGIDDGNIPNRGTYEEACEEAIKYCLNLI